MAESRNWTCLPSPFPSPRSSSAPMSVMVGLMTVLLLVLASGCVSIAERPELVATNADAEARLELARVAHGQNAFAKLRDIAVSYDGEWLNGVAGFQPTLVDAGYRKRSQERILFDAAGAITRIAQIHNGPDGVKTVVRTPMSTRVWYDGVQTDSELPIQAADAVADAYSMFLLGPFYFSQRGAILDTAKSTKVRGRRCDQVLAVLRPGFGGSQEDRVLIAIDAETQVVRRLRFTFNALPSTQGVVADVLPADHVRIDGVLWPTSFLEVIRNPLVKLAVHRWRVTGLDTNRGLTNADVETVEFSPAATVQAGG